MKNRILKKMILTVVSLFALNSYGADEIDLNANVGCRVVIERNPYPYSSDRMLRKNLVLRELKRLGYTVVGYERDGFNDFEHADISLMVSRTIEHGMGAEVSAHYVHTTGDAPITYFEKLSTYMDHNELHYSMKPRKFVEKVMQYYFPMCPSKRKVNDQIIIESENHS